MQGETRRRGPADRIFQGERPLTEEQRTDAVKMLLSQGFTVADVWLIAPQLLAVDPGTAEIVAIPSPLP